MMIRRYRIGALDISAHTNSSFIKKMFDSFMPQDIIIPARPLKKNETDTHNRYVRALMHLGKDCDIKVPSRTRASFTASFKLGMFHSSGIPRVFSCNVYRYRKVEYTFFSNLAVIKQCSSLKQAIIIFSSATAVDGLLEIVFNYFLFNLLEKHGLFALHAAGVAKDGMAVVFPAISGSGKSTLAAALMFSGFKWIGDDVVVFFSHKKPGFSVFPAFDAPRIKIDSRSLALLSLLKPPARFRIRPVDLPLPSHEFKQFFLSDTGYLEPNSRLKALVFPELSQRTTSYIRKLTPKQAAERLFFCGIFFPYFRLSQNRIAAKLRNISDLVSNTESYHFSLGRDIENWSGIITSLLAKGYA